MQQAVIDFESYYDRDLSVKRYGNLNYLNQTNVYLLAIAGEDGFEWVGDPRAFDWSQLKNATVWAHNFAFDGAYFLSRDLSLPGCQFNCSANLAAFQQAPRALDKGAKMLLGTEEVSKDIRRALKGRQWHVLDNDEQEAVAQYALQDARTALQIVAKYGNNWPILEQELSRHTIIMGWEGIGIDALKLERYLQRVSDIRAAAVPEIPWAVDEAGAPLSLLQARRYCQNVGVEPPKSFAEKNEGYLLWEAQYRSRVPWVAAVSRYRKATLLQARLEAMQRRIWEPTGRLTYEMKYHGAHTGRWSGSAGLNLQNLRKLDFHGISLRSLLVPGPGKKLLVIDLSQIEPRVLHWLCGDTDTLDIVRAGYSFYEAQAKAWGLWNGKPGTLKNTDSDLYASVKRLALGAGYGMGPRRFRTTVAEQMNLIMTLEEARRQLNDYRARNRRVVAYWNRLDRQLQMSVGAGQMEIVLPSGRQIAYKNLSRHHGDVYATFSTPEGYRENKIWGGFATENVVSAVARDVFCEGLLRLIRAGLKVVLHCHDEYVLEVGHDVKLEDALPLLRQSPEWARDLPVDCEGWEGSSYAHA